MEKIYSWSRTKSLPVSPCVELMEMFKFYEHSRAHLICIRFRVLSGNNLEWKGQICVVLSLNSEAKYEEKAALFYKCMYELVIQHIRILMCLM